MVCGNKVFKSGLTEAGDKPPVHTPANASVFKISAVAEHVVPDGKDLDRDSNHRPQSAARLPRVHRDRPLEAVHLQLQEEQAETAYLTRSPVS